MPGFMIVLTWVKVFLIDMEFHIGEVSRGHFYKSCKSEEKLLGGGGEVRGYDRLVMNLEYLVFKIEQSKMKKKNQNKKKMSK